MSLVVAAAERSSVWMVSDTAITDQKRFLRERSNEPKIERSHDSHAPLPLPAMMPTTVRDWSD
jgi:hypothetical protein